LGRGDFGLPALRRAAPSGTPAPRPEAPIPRDPKTAGLLYALGAYLVWGLSPIYFKAVSAASPPEILSWRVVGSVAFLGGLVALSGRSREVRSSLADPRRLAIFVATTLLISSNWIVYIWSVNSGHILEASLGYYVNPLVNVLLGVVFLREALNGRQIAAVALAAAGVLYLVAAVGRLPWISLWLATTFGLYGLLRKKARIDAVLGLLVETSLLAPVAVLHLGWLAARGEGRFGASWSLSALLLAAGVITAVPLIWFTLGVHRLRLSTMGFLQYLGPSLQLALAVWVYGEPFTRAQAVTFAFVWASLAVYSWDAIVQARRGAATVPAVEPFD
jgi:chloramphenicol-sensitive protein RarD